MDGIYAWLDGWMVGWRDGWLDGWMDGWMDGMHTWMDGWMAYMHAFTNSFICAPHNPNVHLCIRIQYVMHLIMHSFMHAYYRLWNLQTFTTHHAFYDATGVMLANHIVKKQSKEEECDY